MKAWFVAGAALALSLPVTVQAAETRRSTFGSARLVPGQTYRNIIVCRFSTVGGAYAKR